MHTRTERDDRSSRGRILALHHGARTLRRVEVGGIALSEVTYDDGFTLPRHSHPYPSLTFVLTGSFTEVSGRREHCVTEQSLIVKPAAEVHTDHIGRQGAHSLLMEIPDPTSERFAPFVALLNAPRRHGSQVLSAIARSLQAELRLGDAQSELALEGLMLQLLAETTRQPSSARAPRARPRWLDQAVALIDDSFRERVKLTTIAEHVGVHPAHLSRVFRQHYNCSIGQYIRRLQVDHASELLRSSSRSISEIALICGFCDQSYFTNAFKRCLGTTPHRYRTACIDAPDDPTPQG